MREGSGHKHQTQNDSSFHWKREWELITHRDEPTVSDGGEWGDTATDSQK
jgi:hypothetical protein